MSVSSATNCAVAQGAADDHVGQADDAGALDRKPQRGFGVIGGDARPHLDDVDAARRVLNGQRLRPGPATTMQS